MAVPCTFLHGLLVFTTMISFLRSHNARQDAQISIPNKYDIFKSFINTSPSLSSQLINELKITSDIATREPTS